MGDEPDDEPQDAQFGLSRTVQISDPDGRTMELEFPKVADVIDAANECDDCDYDPDDEKVATLCTAHGVDLLLANEGQRVQALTDL